LPTLVREAEPVRRSVSGLVWGVVSPEAARAVLPRMNAAKFVSELLTTPLGGHVSNFETNRKPPFLARRHSNVCNWMGPINDGACNGSSFAYGAVGYRD